MKRRLNKKDIFVLLLSVCVVCIVIVVILNFRKKYECWKWLQSLQEDEITVTVMCGEYELEKEEKEKLVSLIKQTSIGDIRELVNSAIGDGSTQWLNIITDTEEYQLFVSFVKMYDVAIKYEGVPYVMTNPELQEYMDKIVDKWERKLQEYYDNSKD